jgi:2-haloacid dehalogenase
LSEICHIVFDLGRVVLHWEPEIPYRRLIPDQANRRRFLTDICNANWLRQTDLGTSWDDAERELIAQHPDEEELIGAFRRNWHEMTPDVVEGTPDIIEALIKDGHDVTALTNFAEDTFEEAKERFPLLGSFRGVTVSAHVRLAKPDPAIFHRHARDFHLEPSATLFFDDMPDNVATARQAGWNAEHFADAETLRADLRRYGIDIR